MLTALRRALGTLLGHLQRDPQQIASPIPDNAMPRRLVVCADGTWNTPDQLSDGRPAPTNVWKMFNAVRACPAAPDGSAQVAYYHEGVGTAPGIDHLLEHINGGAFGLGIDTNIKDCYRWLVQSYREGHAGGGSDDEIYLFGFSRGAYTVRSLAGLIRKCGLLPVDRIADIGAAYEFYRLRGDDNAPDSPAAHDFRQQHESREVRIRCIGVWDTVGALGIPLSALKFLDGDRYNFHDVQLSSYVDCAFHALAIDEHRRPFVPTLFEPQDVPGQVVEQVWFAGVHSNVGGGYPDTGLSDIAFLWMAERAASCGLALDLDYIRAHIITPTAARVLYDSMTPVYESLGPYERPIGAPRTDADKHRQINTHESVHTSVFELFGTVVPKWVTPYAPANLKTYLAQHPAVAAGRPLEQPAANTNGPANRNGPADHPGQ